MNRPLPRSASCTLSRHGGFTLVELLVVMAIIGILAALLFPAVQAVRETARNRECLNNIRQLGFAFQSYEGTLRHYPHGWLDRQVSGGPDMDFRYGWSVLISQFIEMDNLYRTYDTRSQYWADNIDQVQVDATTPVSTFICPSDPAPDMNGNWTGFVDTTGAPIEVAKMNYCGNFGIGKLGGNGIAVDPNIEYRTVTPAITGSGELGDANGIFCCNSKVRHRDITDGTSHTLVFGERGGIDWDANNPANAIPRSDFPNLLLRIGLPPDTFTPNCPLGAPVTGLGGDGACQVGQGPMVQPAINGPSGASGPYGGTGAALVNTAGNDYDPRDYLINAATDYDEDGLNAYSSGYSSNHSGGANFVFCDGATKFIPDALDLLTFQRILQRNDGSTINVDSF